MVHGLGNMVNTHYASWLFMSWLINDMVQHTFRSKLTPPTIRTTLLICTKGTLTLHNTWENVQEHQMIAGAEIEAAKGVYKTAKTIW